MSLLSLHSFGILATPASLQPCTLVCSAAAHMCSSVCFSRCAMRAVAGEFGVESKAAACFKGAWVRAVHVVFAGSARNDRAWSEIA